MKDECPLSLIRHMRDEFITAIKRHQADFSLSLLDDQIEHLARFYSIVQENNPILHLVGPCSLEEFAIRHVLESLTLLEHFPQKAKFADVGTGAGLPSIPCLLVRDDLKAVLIESKEKKTKFLESAVEQLGLSKRVSIVNHQFEEAEPGGCEFVTCRALDKFTEKLPRLLKWSKKRRLLLFGGDNLRKALQKQGLTFDEKLMPMSEQRFLLVSRP
jgi:16S rRNA (guanine(527)-N(7))-methyltransferase RsmG